MEQGRERNYYLGDAAAREQERDSSKFWKHNNIRIAYFGFENESEAEEDMAYRVIGYDGAAYRDQICYYKGKDGKRHKSSERFPVITLVLHMGYEHPWDKARSLYEALGSRIPEKLMPYVKDYELNIFDIAFLSDETVAKFQSDFRIVADYLVQMRKNRSYVPSEQTIVHVREVLNFLSAVTDDARFQETAEEILKGDEPKNMCTVLDKVENKGRREGLKEGRKEGRKEGFLDAAELMNYLWSNGRGDEAKKASTDSELLDRLLSEFKAAEKH